jgi:hypothetical protein
LIYRFGADLDDIGIPWVVINVAPPVFEMIGLGVLS